MSSSAGLRWTGNAVIDMGAVAVTLAAGVESPKDVTAQEWHEIMEDLKQNYIEGLFKKPSLLLLTTNAFENPSWSKKPEAREQKILETFELTSQPTPLGDPCTFFPERPAVARAARDQMPLLQGQNQINFYPHGLSEIAVSDIALGCILALPLVSPVISGRLMIIWADDTNLCFDLCWDWYNELQAERAKLRLAKDISDRKAPRSRFLDRLDKLFSEPRKREHSQSGLKKCSGITLYHLSNGSNAPQVDIYTIPPHVTEFFHRAQGGKYKSSWNALVNSFWLNTSGKFLKSEPPEDKRRLRKNRLYEGIFLLPNNSLSFVRRYFKHFVFNRVGIRDNLTVQDIDLWPLLQLFLTEVMHMQQERIDKIRDISDELASEIKQNNNKSLYKQLMGLIGGHDSYAVFRQLLIRAARERLKRENTLLLTLDEYLLVFDEGEEFPRADWRLARDLVRLRCLETLHKTGYFTEAPELLEEETNEEIEQETETL